MRHHSKKPDLEFTLFSPQDFLQLPWANGQGQTLELAKDTQTEFRWRLSRATLKTGENLFSVFPRYHRTLVNLSKSRLLFYWNSQTKTVAPLEVIHFDGAWNTRCVSEEPCYDFNVFGLKDYSSTSTHVFPIHQDEKYQLPLAGKFHFAYVVKGKLLVLEPHSSRTFHVPHDHLLQIHRNPEYEYLNLRLTGQHRENTVVWVSINCS